MGERKNDLLEQTLKRLLDYRGQPGTYNVSDMHDAMTERSKEDLSTLSKAEREECEQFVSELEEELRVSWLKMFLEERQARSFKIVDIASWAPGHLSFGVRNTRFARTMLARQFVWTFAETLEDFANKGFLKRIKTHPSLFSNVYQVVLDENNPLIDWEKRPKKG